MGLKMAILISTWKLLAPSWRQVGAILVQFGEILAVPSRAKIDQNLPRQLQVAPRSSQTPSGPRFFQVFGSFLLLFFVISRRIRVQLLLLISNLSEDFFKSFLLERSSERSPMGGWAAVLARRASSIIYNK